MYNFGGNQLDKFGLGPSPITNKSPNYGNTLANPMAVGGYNSGNAESSSSGQYGFRGNDYRTNFNFENQGQSLTSFKEAHQPQYKFEYYPSGGFTSSNYATPYQSGSGQTVSNPMANFQKQTLQTPIGGGYLPYAGGNSAAPIAGNYVPSYPPYGNYGNYGNGTQVTPTTLTLDPTIKIVDQYVPPPLPKPAPAMGGDQQKTIQDLMKNNQNLDKQKLLDLGNLGKVVYSAALCASATSQKYNDLLSDLRKSNKKFTDSDFPPNKSSLAPPSNQGEYRDVASWKRASEIFKNPQLFEGKIEANDILQGNLGDCYLLSTLAAIAENPDRIKKLFLASDYSQEGIYAVQICWRGADTEVIIDDHIAVDKKNEPYFLKSRNNELWVALLEKAWAKLHRNYHQIDGQLTKESLHDFTGAPVRSFRTNRDQEQLWQRMVEGDQKGYIMTTGTEGDDCGTGDPLRKFGLVSGHAYTLIGANNVQLNNGTTARLVQIRNPWGEFEWKGKWNDHDNLWNNVSQSEKSRIGFTVQDDGTFFLEYSNMLDYFDGVQICYYLNTHDYFGISVYSSYQEAKYFEIKLNRSGFFYFNISQITIRYFDVDYQDSPNSHYSDTKFAIADSTGKVLQGYSGRKRDLYSPQYIDQPFQFAAGTYYAYVKVIWQKCSSHHFGFGAYGPGGIEITEIKPEQAKTLPQQIQPWEQNRYPQFDIEQIALI